METRNNPDPNGCLAKALPGEPMFILLARDECAPATINYWADLRAQNGVEQIREQGADQIVEAIDTADAFRKWRAENEGAWRAPRQPEPPATDDRRVALNLLTALEALEAHCRVETGMRGIDHADEGQRIRRTMATLIKLSRQELGLPIDSPLAHPAHLYVCIGEENDAQS